MKTKRSLLFTLLVLGAWSPSFTPRVEAAASPGIVVAWGQNNFGQTTVPAGLNGVTAIAGGGDHTVALKSDGTVVAWGNNAFGQTTVPVGLSGVRAIAVGYRHTVALKNDGTVVAWGYNLYGQTTVPAGLSGVTAIAGGGEHTVALRSDGTVVAWGYNNNGQTNVPAGLSGVTAIAGGALHTVALKNDGTVVAWGLNNFGQATVPAGLSGVTRIAAGYNHTLALKSDGTVVAWGLNNFGQTTVPAGLSGVTAIAGGGEHTVALKSDGTVVAWGYNAAGQTTVPVGLTRVTAVAAGLYHSVAVVGTDQMLIRDEFDGTVLNTNSWESAAPFGDSQMTTSSGLALFANRGRLLTKASFGSAVEVRGKFKLAGSSYDIFAVYFRTDGTVGGGGSFQSGVAAEFKYRGSDQGQVGVGNVLVHVPGVSILATANFPLQLNTWYDFKISDNGTTIGIFLADLDNPIITTTTTARNGSRVGFQNREGLAGGSSISAGSVTHVDSVFVRDYPTGLAAFTSVEVEFPTDAGKAHQIQVSEDLVTWRNLGPPISGSGLLFQRTIQTRFDSRLFYRVQTTP